MKKGMTIMVAMFFLFALATPMVVSASTEDGIGQNRTVTLVSDANVDGNITDVVIGVPVLYQNDTNTSFMLTAQPHPSTNISVDDYLLNISINNNGTWYNESVAFSSLADENVTAYINYTADTFILNETCNITIQLVYDTNYTVADEWWGEVGFVDANDYAMRVTMMELLVSVMSLFILVWFVMTIFKYLKNAVEPSKKKK